MGATGRRQLIFLGVDGATAGHRPSGTQGKRPMARRRATDPSQLGMFDDPILWWPGRPPGPKEGEANGPLRRPRRAENAPEAGQLALFDLPAPPPAPAGSRGLRHRLRARMEPQTYLELACKLGLIRLQQILQQPATYYLIDAQPLQDGLRVDTLLEARYRIVSGLQDAFEDLADLAPLEVRSCRFALWGGRRLGISDASSPEGEVLSLAISPPDARVEDPFRLRLRGLPGYLGHSTGPSPLEEGEELLSLYDREVLYNLLPLEAQPMPLETLLVG